MKILNKDKMKKEPDRLISIEETIKSLRRPLMLIAITGVIANLSILGLEIMVLKGQKKPVALNTIETCYRGMSSVFNNMPNRELVSEKIMKDLKETTFKIDKIHLLKVIDGYNCDVFTKDSQGVRRYNVSLDKSIHYSHTYKIVDIKETKVDSRYQL